MVVEFLYWQECPSHAEALRRLHEVLHEEGVAEPVRVVRVETDEEARRLNFPGSPTIRFNGEDVQPELLPQLRLGLTCRVYHVDGRVSPLPTKEMIRQALRRAMVRSRSETSKGTPEDGFRQS